VGWIKTANQTVNYDQLYPQFDRRQNDDSFRAIGSWLGCLNRHSWMEFGLFLLDKV